MNIIDSCANQISMHLWWLIILNYDSHVILECQCAIREAMTSYVNTGKEKQPFFVQWKKSERQRVNTEHPVHYC